MEESQGQEGAGESLSAFWSHHRSSKPPWPSNRMTKATGACDMVRARRSNWVELGSVVDACMQMLGKTRAIGVMPAAPSFHCQWHQHETEEKGKSGRNVGKHPAMITAWIWGSLGSISILASPNSRLPKHPTRPCTSRVLPVPVFNPYGPKPNPPSSRPSIPCLWTRQPPSTT